MAALHIHATTDINKYSDEKQRQLWTRIPRALAANANCVGRAGVIHTYGLHIHAQTIFICTNILCIPRSTVCL